MMHPPISSDNTHLFYLYLRTQVLIADRQFLLLIDVPIQNRAQQLQIYDIFSLPVPHSNLSAQYEIKAVAFTDLQYRACQHASGHFYRINALFQPLTNLSLCVPALYAKMNRQ